MISTYHVDLAVIALVVGTMVLVMAMRIPALTERAVALAAAAAALLGSLSVSAGAVWVVSATVVVLPPDRAERSHPLGRLTVLLAVVTLAGTWTAVPDTEPPISAGLALLPVGVWSFARRRPPGPVATLALAIAVTGAVWAGSAGWGAALCAVGAVGLIATAPLVIGFRPVRDPRRLAALVALQLALGVLLPRFVAFRTVPVAAATAIGANMAVVVLVATSVRRRNR